MANRIKGITVEIGGDTTKLNKALETVNGTIKGTQSQLKDVEKLLKLDPANTELLAQKQSLLTQAVAGTSEKLEVLKTAAQQAQTQLEQGKITQEQFNALQREIAETSSVMQQYSGKLSESNSTSAKLKTTISAQESELSSLKKQYTDVVLEQGKDSDAAKDLQSKYDQLNSELTDNKNKMSAAESAASALGKANKSARTPLETLKNTVATQETAIAKLSDEYQNACIQYGKNSTQAQNLAGKIKLLSSEHQNSKNQLSAMENGTKKLTSAEQGLTEKLSSQKQDLSKLKQEYVDVTAKYGKHSAEAKSLEQQIKTLSGEISSEEKTVTEASQAADKFDKSMKNAGDSAKTAGEKAAARSPKPQRAVFSADVSCPELRRHQAQAGKRGIPYSRRSAKAQLHPDAAGLPAGARSCVLAAAGGKSNPYHAGHDDLGRGNHRSLCDAGAISRRRFPLLRAKRQVRQHDYA